MRKFWLLFAQATTIGLATLFIIQTLRPTLLPNAARNGVVTLYEDTGENGAVTSNQIPTTGFSVAAQKVMPAVVNIYTSSEVKAPSQAFINDPRFRFFFGDQFEENAPQQSSSLGSGVIVSHDGYILTNHHVIESADQIEVALSDGRKAKGHIVGSDPETDLAVIKIDFGNNLPAITFGHAEQSRVGDIVLAIGNPFGVGQTVTMGIISALKRNHLGLNTFENFIQTDAAINPGNSGGALVDANGNLIGINSAIYSPNGGSLGIGFAIPVSTAKKIMEQIIQNGSVVRGWIGVAVQDLTPELLESFKLGDTQGVLIAEVVRGSPADKAGVRAGDILLSIADKPLTDSNIMLETISALPPNTVTPLKLLRNQSEVLVQVKVGKRPKPKPQE
jgi:serine protease DegQ